MKSYKAYSLILNEKKLMLKMHLSILKGLFISQIIIMIVFFVVIVNNINPKDISFRKSLSGDNADYSTELTPFKYAFYGSFTVYLLWPVIIFRSKKKAENFGNKTIRGARLIDEKKLNKLLPKEKSNLQLTDSISIPKDHENRHFLGVGTMGSGKSTILKNIIDQLRNFIYKVLIYDRKDGEYVTHFYEPGRDLIYSPWDKRSIYWNVLDGKTTESDFDSLAASIVPSASGKDKFFNDSARDVLADIFKYCYLHKRTSNQDIWDILCLPVSQLHKCLLKINSAASVYILNHNSGQTQGTVSTLYQYTKIFKYLRFNNGKKPFSLHEWVNNERQKGFIFLPNYTKQRDSLKGILSAFVNSFANEVLSLKDDLSRRIFVFLDEFGTLQKMDAVKDLIVLTRSKGCSFWIGIQDKSQLDHIYGPEISNTIINNCNNYIIFRLNGYDNAKYFSDLLGESEKDFSLVLGQKDIQNQQAYRNYAKIDKLVLPSEIQALPDLNFYLKLHGYPVTLTSTEYKLFPEITDAFIPNPALQSIKAEGQKMIISNKTQKEIKIDDPVNQRLKKNKTDEQGFSIDEFNF